MSERDFFTSVDISYRRGNMDHDCRVDDETLHKERMSLIEVRKDYEFLYHALTQKIKDASLSIENINFDRMEESVKKNNQSIQYILLRLDEAIEKLYLLEKLVVDMNECRWR